MRNLTDVALAIRRGSRSAELLEEFFEKLEENYYQMNLLELTMNYYDNFLFFSEGQTSKEGLALFRRVNSCIEKVILNLGDAFFPKEEVFALRQEIEDRTEGVSIFQSAFWNFRYALKRRILKSDLEIGDRDEVSKEILEFIFKDEDSMLINDRISNVIGCLPIRYTKGKFLELVENAVKQYQNADKLSLERFVYGIKHAGMLSFTEKVETLFPKLSAEFSHFRELEIAKLSQEEVERELERIEKDLHDCEEMLEEYLRLIHIVNCFYLPIHVKKDLEVKTEEECISLIHDCYLNQKLYQEGYEEKIYSLFERLEGKIEELYDKTRIPEDVLLDLEHTFGKRLREEGLFVRYEILKNFNLLSKSSFVSFENLKKRGEILSKEELEEEKQSLLTELEGKLKEMKLPVRRAMMAQILGSLPVYFENRTEVMYYVREALSTCDNKAELNASVQEFYSIRSEDDYN